MPSNIVMSKLRHFVDPLQCLMGSINVAVHQDVTIVFCNYNSRPSESVSWGVAPPNSKSFCEMKKFFISVLGSLIFVFRAIVGLIFNCL